MHPNQTSEQSRRISLSLAVSLFILQSLGCTSHRSQTGAFYKLTQIDSQYFLVPNGSRILGRRQQFQISIAPAQEQSVQKNCSIHGEWFSLYPADPPTTQWTVETPSADAWAAAGGHVDLKPEWDRFLREISTLSQKQCFSADEGLAAIKQKIVTGMAMPADESLLYRYSYGQAGYVDLGPGMELRIERNVATANASTPMRTIVTSYGFSSVGGNGVQISFLGSQGDIASDSALKLPDGALATEFKATPHLRLILQRLEVSANSSNPAILLGGSEINDLDAATAAANRNPNISCDELRKSRVTCVEFEGLVTVSPVLDVTVNGRPAQVPLGSKVTYVFPPTDDYGASISKSLKIRRQSGGGYRELEFARNEDDVGQILIFGGDEISFAGSKQPRSKHR